MLGSRRVGNGRGNNHNGKGFSQDSNSIPFIYLSLFLRFCTEGFRNVQGQMAIGSGIKGVDALSRRRCFYIRYPSGCTLDLQDELMWSLKGTLYLGPNLQKKIGIRP
jgi:hypothetical protein